jgi:hypothetical protein
MPRTPNTLAKITGLLSNPTYQCLIDTNYIANHWLQNDPNVISNISKVLLTGFYLNYKQTLNENIQNLDQDFRDDSCDVLKEVMFKNESEFLNSFNNILITNYQHLEYLTSAIETSHVLLESAKDVAEPMQSLEGLFDASTHLFSRLSVYQLMPIWGVSIRASHEVIQQWNHNAWYNFPTHKKALEEEEEHEHEGDWGIVINENK